MMSPSPFQVAKGISDNFGEAYGQARDINSIDEILTRVSSSGNDVDIDNAMTQILSRVSPQNQKAALGILQGKKDQIIANRNKSKLGETYEGLGLPPGIENLSERERAEFLKNKLAVPKVDQKAVEKQEGLQHASNILSRQRELLQSGHLGPKVGIIGTGRKAGSTFSKQGQSARAEYEQLGKSLISYATNIPIRNRLEFETLAHKLFDPTMTQEEIDGTLKSMERIVNQQIKKPEGEEIDVTEAEQVSLQPVQPGTKLTDKTVIAQIAGKAKNKQEAMRMARQLGYDI